MFSFWGKGFFWNLYVLYGGLGIGKLYFLIKKNLVFFPAVFGHQNPGSGLDPDRYPIVLFVQNWKFNYQIKFWYQHLSLLPCPTNLTWGTVFTVLMYGIIPHFVWYRTYWSVSRRFTVNKIKSKHTVPVAAWVRYRYPCNPTRNTWCEMLLVKKQSLFAFMLWTFIGDYKKEWGVNGGQRSDNCHILGNTTICKFTSFHSISHLF